VNRAAGGPEAGEAALTHRPPPEEPFEGPPDGLFGSVRPPAREPRPRRDDVAFAHSSEQLFARLLDFYGIAWEYEARSFDLAWNEDGSPSEAFTPDFYLPVYDLYVELTTMNQKLVTRKNRKLRRLREMYPDVRCRMFYQRDIFRLATKHGLAIPTEDLTSRDGDV
jgi:hypoxanthine phosphoribosyltransferase